MQSTFEDGDGTHLVRGSSRSCRAARSSGISVVGESTESSPTLLHRVLARFLRPVGRGQFDRAPVRLLATSALSWSLFLSACGSADSDRSEDAAKQVDDSTETESSALPVEPLLFPGADALIAFQDAYTLLVQECMSALGYTFEPEVVLPPAELMNPIEPHRRYGDLSVEQAGEFGYKNPFAEYERTVADRTAGDEDVPPGYFEALTGAPSLDPSTGRMSPSDDGCAPTATRTIFGNNQGLEGLPGYAEILRVQQDSFARAAVDDAVQVAERTWSDCMLAEGFRFSSSAAPLEQWASAVDDNTAPSEEELAVAAADAACRDSAGLFEAWLQAESRIQLEMLEGMTEQVQVLQTAIDEALRNASTGS